jgi:hypothetical protein
VARDKASLKVTDKAYFFNLLLECTNILSIRIELARVETHQIGAAVSEHLGRRVVHVHHTSVSGSQVYGVTGEIEQGTVLLFSFSERVFSVTTKLTLTNHH